MKPSKQTADQVTKDKDELPEHWGLVQGAIWMIGIAVLAITGWWWPGIMIVVAISLLTEAAVRYSLKNQEDKQSAAAIETDLEAQRARRSPTSVQAVAALSRSKVLFGQRLSAPVAHSAPRACPCNARSRPLPRSI